MFGRLGAKSHLEPHHQGSVVSVKLSAAKVPLLEYQVQQCLLDRWNHIPAILSVRPLAKARSLAPFSERSPPL